VAVQAKREVDVLLPKPHPSQVDVLSHPARHKVVCCGRRWGKTVLGLLSVTIGHGAKDTEFRGALRGANVWWVAPIYPTASMIWRDLKHSLRGAWVDKSETERRIVLPGGGAVTVRSADDPESLVGPGLDGIVMDECKSIRREAWYEFLRPTLTERQGWSLFLSTPKGTANWFHELYESAGRTDGWARWQLPTSQNPIILPVELERAKIEMGSLLYAQEYEAQFVSGNLGIFRREWFRVVAESPVSYARVRAWDLAATVSGDYTVGVLMSRTEDGWCVEHIVRGRWTPGARNDVILQTARGDGKVVRVIVEQEGGSGGIAQVEELQRLLSGFSVMGVHPTGDKVTRASPFSAKCEAKRVLLREGPWVSAFLDELESFPNGSYDDIVDATVHSWAALPQSIHRGAASVYVPERGPTAFDDLRGMTIGGGGRDGR